MFKQIAIAALIATTSVNAVAAASDEARVASFTSSHYFEGHCGLTISHTTEDRAIRFAGEELPTNRASVEVSLPHKSSHGVISLETQWNGTETLGGTGFAYKYNVQSDGAEDTITDNVSFDVRNDGDIENVEINLYLPETKVTENSVTGELSAVTTMTMLCFDL